MTDMHSLPAFLAIAFAVTLSPGPAFALMLQVAARDGWRAAMANIGGNSVGVLMWGVLSAVGVSALVAANRIAYDALHVGGAIFLLWLGVSAIVRRKQPDPGAPAATPPRERTARQAARKGLINSVANPKLAIFFVSLFPQFVAPGDAVLPAALAMSGAIVACDVVWYGSIAFCVDRFRRVIAAKLLRGLERTTGVVLLGFGARLAVERP
ncbi:MAG: LysE family translocator [Frankiaceae bacterium]|nr:LysE family translocator [Frankiaceae bacterium]MBV9873044.1 LysE family translocator [Frankiaceae bacterium]